MKTTPASAGKATERSAPLARNLGQKTQPAAPLQGPPVPDDAADKIEETFLSESVSKPAAGALSGRSKRAEHYFLRRVVLFYGVTFLFMLMLTAIWFASSVLLMIFACSLMAILLYDLTGRIRKYLPLSHTVALSFLVVSVCVVFGSGAWLIAPQISEQAQQLAEALPKALQGLQVELAQTKIFKDLLSSLPEAKDIISEFSGVLPKAGLFFGGLVGGLANFIIIIFVGIYLAVQPHTYINGFVRLMPPHKRARTREVLDEIGMTLGQWLAGKLLSMIVVGFCSAVGLLLLDVPLALILGVLIGVLDFIPYLGPILAGIPAVLIAFSVGPDLALYTLLLLLALQGLEGYLLIPQVERRTVALPPAVTILMQVLLGTLFGLTGVALATPLAAVVATLVIALYVQDVLGDKVKTPSEQSQEEKS